MITHPWQSNGRSTNQTKFCCFRGPHASMCYTSIWLCTQLRTIGHLCSFHKGRQCAHWNEPTTFGIHLGIQKNHMPMPKLTFRTKPPRPPQQSWITVHGDKRQTLTRYGDGMSCRKRLLLGTINQGGYITPAASGIPTASERGAKSEVAQKWARWLHNPCHLGDPTASERGAKSEVAHKWARWLHNLCRLGDPHRFRAGGKIRSGPQVGKVATSPLPPGGTPPLPSGGRFRSVQKSASPLHYGGSLGKGTKSKVAALGARTTFWMSSPKEYHQKKFYTNDVCASKNALKSPPHTIFKGGGGSKPPTVSDFLETTPPPGSCFTLGCLCFFFFSFFLSWTSSACTSSLLSSFCFFSFFFFGSSWKMIRHCVTWSFVLRTEEARRNMNKNDQNTSPLTKAQKLPARLLPISTTMLPCDHVLWMKRPCHGRVHVVRHGLGQVQVAPLLPFVVLRGRHLSNPSGVEPSRDRGGRRTPTAVEHQEADAQDAKLVGRLHYACIVCDERYGTETNLFGVKFETPTCWWAWPTVPGGPRPRGGCQGAGTNAGRRGGPLGKRMPSRTS